MKTMMLGMLMAWAALAAIEAKLEYTQASTKTIVDFAYEAPAGLAGAGTRDPLQQVGLILCFPEHDRPTGDEIYPVRESLRRQGLSEQYVLIGVHPQAQKFGDADHEPIRRVIEWAKKQYPVNPRRIYMYGKGEGAKISGEFGTQNAGLITAAVTYSWGWWKIPADSVQPPELAPSYYMVLGMRDLLTHLQTVRDTYSRMNEKGYDIIFREFDELGARTYHPPSNDDGLAWALRHRNKNVSPTPEEMALLKEQTTQDAYFKNFALVGGTPASLILGKLMGSPNAKIRAAAVATCAEMICEEGTLSLLKKTLVDSDAKVRAATLRTLAMNANWRSSAAQKVLIDYVKAPKDPLDRKGAIDALAFAVRYQVKGVRQDPAMFETFVGLLQDSDEEARTMAANVLAPIRDKDFRGDLGRKELKEPEGGWTAWLQGIKAKQMGYRHDYAVCEQGPGEGAVKLFCEGRKTGKNRAGSFAKTKEAAEMGYAPAQAMLGMMYANGSGTQQDYKEAAVWWQKAAEQGHTLAAQNLARVPGRRAAQVPPPAPVK